MLLQPSQLVQVLDPLLAAQGLGDELPKAGVAVGQPPAGGHAVRLVLELLGVHLVEVLEDGVLDDVRMDGRHPVGGFAADHGHERHVDQPAMLPFRISFVPDHCQITWRWLLN